MKKVLPLIAGLGIIAALIYFAPYKNDVVLFGSTGGPNSPGTMADDATVGTLTWTDPNNAKVADSNWARAQPPDGTTETTHYLKATNFGFSIPTGSTIDGILVEILRVRLLGGSVTDSEVKIVKSDGTIGTTNKAIGTAWPSFPLDAYYSYGSSSDLWGETWTTSDINDVDFGMVLSASVTATASGRAQVDHIRITVTYTEGSTVSSQTVIVNASQVITNANMVIQ